MNSVTREPEYAPPPGEVDEDWSNSADVPLPRSEDIFMPGFWQVALMPRRAPARSKGGVILPDVYRSQEQWLNYVGEIIALGPLAYRHKKYRDMGITDPDNDQRVPRRGQFWCYKPYSPYRMEFNGIRFIALADDSLIGRVPDKCNPWDYRAGV